MAKVKISDFSSTPGNNTEIDNINISEGCAPSGINDAIRELMAQLKDFQTGAAGDSFNGPVGTTTAAAGAFTTLSASGAVTLSGGTANGVAYLNGSKVLTTGSALTFDGTNLSATGTTTVNSANSTQVALVVKGETGNGIRQNFIGQTSSGQYNWQIGASITAAGNFAIIPSTAVDGTTFSTAAYAITGTGTSIWSVAGSEQMRLTSTGLGIGTSSPAAKLHVSGDALANTFKLIANTTVSGSDATIFRPADNTMAFSTNGAERMRLDQSGNLGLGVTPSAWGSIFRGMQIVGGASIFGRTDSTQLNLIQNAYYDGSSFRYLQNNTAARMTLDSGGVQFNIAPSGTAGNAISFTQAATLTAAGEWLVGATSTVNAAKAVFSFNSSNNGVYIIDSTGVSGAQFMRFDSTSGTCGSITRVGTTSAVLYNTSSDYRLKNINGPLINSGAYIDSLKPVEGSWKADGSVFVGLLAHEAQEVSRTSVATGEKDGKEMQAMDYGNSEFIANIIAELQSLRKRVAELEAK